MIRIGVSASMNSCCASIHPCSRSRRPLASSGSVAPLPYPVGRYSARTVLPSGLDHQNAVRSHGTRHAAPHDCVVEAELPQDLRHLRDVPEHVGQVPDAHRAAEARGALESELQIADDRLAGDEELVHEDVPRTHRDAAAGGEAAKSVFGLGANREVVVDHCHLPVEQEVRVRRVGLEPWKQVVEQIDQSQRKVWNGEYHSRSQWVCGTTATRLAISRPYPGPAAPMPGSEVVV